MSFSQNLFNNIEKVIHGYIDVISKTYNINREELIYLWGSETTLTESKETKTSSRTKTTVALTSTSGENSSFTNVELNINTLHKSTKVELIALCKSRGLKTVGTKDVLVNRLLGKEDTEVKTEKKETKTEKKETKKEQNVVEKISASIPTIAVRRNRFGRFEHAETRLVFDQVNRVVIGKQEDDGSLSDLTEDDIELCKKFKFMYSLPENLDKRETLDTLKIDELEESDIENLNDNVEEDEQDIEEDEEEEIEIEDD